MPGFDFFGQPVNAKLIKALTEDGGYKTIALRREIFIGDNFVSGEKMINELEQIGCFWPNATFGHQARMDRVLEFADFVATPLTYYNRHPGGAFASQSPFHQTALARNCLFLDEVDTRTHIANEVQRRFDSGEIF